MQNNKKNIINILMNDIKIAEYFNKLITGQYSTDRERKELAKAIVDRWSELAKMNTTFEFEKQSIDAQALSMKTWIENLREVNY